MELNQKIPLTQVAEVLAAIALLLWRIWDVPLDSLWHDWVSLLSLYWLFNIFAEGKRIGASVTLMLMAALMLLYGWGQFPYLLALFGKSA